MRNLCHPPFSWAFLCDLHLPFAMFLTTQLHLGQFVPWSSLHRWPHVLVVKYPGQIVWVFCDWGMRASSPRNTLTRTRQVQVCHAGSISVVLIWETHFTRTPQLPGSLSESTGCAVWLNTEAYKESPLVSAEKCNRATFHCRFCFRGKFNQGWYVLVSSSGLYHSEWCTFSYVFLKHLDWEKLLFWKSLIHWYHTHS